jgi:hypothetical protein
MVSLDSVCYINFIYIFIGITELMSSKLIKYAQFPVLVEFYDCLKGLPPYPKEFYKTGVLHAEFEPMELFFLRISNK